MANALNVLALLKLQVSTQAMAFMVFISCLVSLSVIFPAQAQLRQSPQEGAQVAEAKWSRLSVAPLIEPEALGQHLGQPLLRILDIRSQQAYLLGHIPGALNAPYGRWRGPANNPGELPGIDKLTELLQSLGITPEHHIVVTSQGDDPSDFGSAARVYWTLKVLGLERLSLLHGGMKIWNQNRLPVDVSPPEVIRSQFVPVINRTMLPGTEDIRAMIGKPGSRLIDARPSAFFLGQTRHPAALQAGTLKGAGSIEHDRWFVEGSSRFVRESQARDILAKNAIGPNTEVLSFCNTGHWAATNWFAISEVLGHKNTRLYSGSMVEWTRQAEALPMDHVPNRLKSLLIDARLWADKNL